MSPTDPRHLTRRDLAKGAGGALAAYTLLPNLVGGFLTTDQALAAGSGASLTPELTEGPYWVNTMLRRSNVVANTDGNGSQEGVPLRLFINVHQGTSKKPLDGLAVDIWHANAYGIYSDESSQQSGGGDSAAAEDTSGENFLRGYQITGKDHGLSGKAVLGQVSFQTIWPGWYTSRAIHIHVRVRELHSSGATIAGYTTQIFFSDADNERIFNGASPYDKREPKDDPTTDANDSVLTKADYDTNIVKVKGSIAKGYTATFNIAVTTAEVSKKGSLSKPSGGGGGGEPPAGEPPSGTAPPPGTAPPSAT